MTATSSSIDDVLATAHLPPEKRMPPQIQQSVEEKPDLFDKNDDFETEVLTKNEDILKNKQDFAEKPQNTEKKAPKVEKQTEKEAKETEIEDNGVDEYGNERPRTEKKTYTEEEVNERINRAVRERFERFDRNHGQNNQQIQQQQQTQKPNAQDGSEEWKKELRDFVLNTQQEAQREQYQREVERREQEAQSEFTTKLHSGAQKFPDFQQVVGSQPVTEVMALASRSMKDPAAFWYAASKRHPQEIDRISRLPDAYSQMVEIGRLEERMKKTAQTTTRASRPITPPKDDATYEEAPKAAPRFEDLLQENDRNRLSRLGTRRR